MAWNYFQLNFSCYLSRIFWALRAGITVFMLLELKNPAQIARKIELEVISSHYGRNVFSVYTPPLSTAPQSREISSILFSYVYHKYARLQ